MKGRMIGFILALFIIGGLLCDPTVIWAADDAQNLIAERNLLFERVQKCQAQSTSAQLQMQMAAREFEDTRNQIGTINEKLKALGYKLNQDGTLVAPEPPKKELKPTNKGK